MDGYEATKRIRANEKFKHLEIIALTANSSDDDISYCYDIGMDGFLKKPLDRTLLMETLARHFHKMKSKVEDQEEIEKK